MDVHYLTGQCQFALCGSIMSLNFKVLFLQFSLYFHPLPTYIDIGTEHGDELNPAPSLHIWSLHVLPEWGKKQLGKP